MNNNLIITIGREYGTGGREIGQKLALRLGIPFYDRELITRAAKKTGFDEKLFEQLDKRATNSFLYSLTMFGSDRSALPRTVQRHPRDGRGVLLRHRRPLR